ncbi:hypothetical protein [Sphingomonas sp.]|uniref:hypothetical protein n=1 Tax=Sphingomonas sp. TaxID=28214 RepID=UPI003AFFCB1F
MIRSAALLALVVLAGCGHKEKAPEDTRTVSIAFSNPGNAGEGGPAGNAAQALAIDVPGFSAKLDVPGLNFSAGNPGLDGIALQPGTRLTGMKIVGAAGDGSGGDGHGTVDMGFTAPAAPAQVIAYYRDAAKRGGWREVPPAGGQQFAATKPKDSGSEHLALQVAPQGTGSQGRFLVSGS